jgi:hypothetical protein
MARGDSAELAATKSPSLLKENAPKPPYTASRDPQERRRYLRRALRFQMQMATAADREILELFLQSIEIDSLLARQRFIASHLTAKALSGQSCVPALKPASG